MSTKKNSNIAVDIRSIQREPYTGVETYLTSLLTSWKEMGCASLFRLYANQVHTLDQKEALDGYGLTHYHVPNKLLNLSTALFQRPDISRYVHEPLLFLPNQNFLACSENKKLVLFVHDVSFIRFPHFFSRRRRLWHYALRFKKLLKKSCGIITGSQFTAEELTRLFPNETEGKLHTVPLGVKSIYFHQNNYQERKLSSGYILPQRYLLTIGTLEPRKNVEAIITTFSAIAGKDSTIFLVIAGKIGWKAHRLIRMMRHSKFSERILYLGYVSEEDKRVLLRHAHLFLFLSWYEGFGLPPLEAMASGVPVVVTNTGALPEVVGDAGILIHPHQTGEIQAAIEMLLQDSALRNNLTRKGKERAQAFSWAHTAEKTLQILRHYI